MATGQFNSGSGTFTIHTLAESWNGSTWTVLGTTDPQNGPHAFGAVSCTMQNEALTHEALKMKPVAPMRQRKSGGEPGGNPCRSQSPVMPPSPA